jgi:RNA polymerase sigma-70 factor (ECF subfamily)
VVVTGVGFEDCFRQHFPRLVALGQSMTGDREVARELAQEAFVRLHANWTSVAGYEDPSGWLRRVMGNLLIDYHRSRTSERHAVLRLASRAASSVPDVTADGDAWLELVAGLPPRQRAIVTLFYGEDQGVAEIARMLGLSPNSVKSALSKARDSLRDRWKETHAE